MVVCPSCNKEMELITYPQMQIFQCVSCGKIIELPLQNKESIDYNKLLITELPNPNLSDITIVELQKRKSTMLINSDMNLLVTVDSTRDLEILAKNVRRDMPTIKTDTENLQLIISKNELPKIFHSKILSEELTKELSKYFRTIEFLRSYLSTMKDYLNYSVITEEGRLLFNLPNELLTTEIQRILIISKIFFIQEDVNTLYLPWNSILLLRSFIDFPKNLNEQLLSFIIQKWQPSNSYHKNLSFEGELKNDLRKKADNKELKIKKKNNLSSKEKVRSGLIFDYL